MCFPRYEFFYWSSLVASSRPALCMFTDLTLAILGSDDHHMWVAANEAKESQSASQKKANSKMADANKALLR